MSRCIKDGTTLYSGIRPPLLDPIINIISLIRESWWKGYALKSSESVRDFVAVAMTQDVVDGAIEGEIGMQALRPCIVYMYWLNITSTIKTIASNEIFNRVLNFMALLLGQWLV